jgi:hypothetical protein
MTAFLFGDIIFISVWVLLFVLSPKTRKLQLLGSLFLVPFGFTDIFFRPDYWNPPLLIKVIEPLSIETPLYCFSAGGIAAAVAGIFTKTYGLSKMRWQNTLLFFISGFFLFGFFTFFTSLNAMNSLNFSFLIIWLVAIIFHSNDIFKSFGTGLAFAILTIIAVNIGLLFFPGFVSDYWNLSKNWPLFLDTPTEEIFFAGILGALWTLLPDLVTSKRLFDFHRSV